MENFVLEKVSGKHDLQFINEVLMLIEIVHENKVLIKIKLEVQLLSVKIIFFEIKIINDKNMDHMIIINIQKEQINNYENLVILVLLLNIEIQSLY